MMTPKNLSSLQVWQRVLLALCLLTTLSISARSDTRTASQKKLPAGEATGNPFADEATGNRFADEATGNQLADEATGNRFAGEATESVIVKQPRRIVSLAPSITRSLYYLNAQEQLVGHTSFCYIAMNDNKEVVASAVSVNIEKVITLKPDLVVTLAMTNPEVIEMIRKAGIRTEVFQTPKSFEEICNQFERLGVLTGQSDTALAINSHVRQQVYAIRNEHQYTIPPSFFFQIGANPLFTVLENTFMDDYITFLGGRNIAAGFRRGTITREFVITSNPDVIIIVNMGLASEDEKQLWERYPFLNAVKHNRILFVESDMASTPNPPDFLNTLQAINNQLPKGWWK